MNKKTFSLANSLISILLLAGILVFANLIFNKFFTRIDLTKNKRFSITQGTKKMLGKLPSNLIIKGYLSKDMPAPYDEVINYTKDMLKEFEVYSGGRLKVEIINPDDLKETEKEELMYSGIRPIQAQVMKDDKFEIKKGYLGVAMFFQDKKEVIPVLSDTSNLEYDIITKLLKLTEEKQKQIGFFSLSDVYKFDNLKKLLGEKYTTVDLTVKDGKFDNPNIDTLIVAGGEKEPEDGQLAAIDQFVISGKPVIFLADSYSVSLSNLQKTPINKRLQEFLQNYGITLGSELVFDNQNNRISVQSQQGMFTFNSYVNFPYIPLANNFNKNHPLVSSLSDMSFAFVTKLGFNKKDDINFEWLVKSSDNSFEYTPQSLDPTKGFQLPSGSPKGPFVIGGILSGKFKSFFADKGITVSGSALDIKKEGVNQKVFVFSDEDFLTDNILSKGNAIFFQNAIDWSNQSEDLIKIRSKNISIPKLIELPAEVKKVVKSVNIFLIPLIIIIIGLIRLYGRKAKEGKLYE